MSIPTEKTTMENNQDAFIPVYEYLGVFEPALPDSCWREIFGKVSITLPNGGRDEILFRMTCSSTTIRVFTNRVPPPADRFTRMRIALFVTEFAQGFADLIAWETGRASIALLQSHGPLLGRLLPMDSFQLFRTFSSDVFQHIFTVSERSDDLRCALHCYLNAIRDPFGPDVYVYLGQGLDALRRKFRAQVAGVEPSKSQIKKGEKKEWQDLREFLGLPLTKEEHALLNNITDASLNPRHGGALRDHREVDDKKSFAAVFAFGEIIQCFFNKLDSSIPGQQLLATWTTLDHVVRFIDSTFLSASSSSASPAPSASPVPDSSPSPSPSTSPPPAPESRVDSDPAPKNQ